ncbi:MAG: hypothetical protein F4Z82_17595 [Caldilineaceae bacterium SB0668_bin_21]|nr:hypothetical protein [Caldilineaceae bacterium SB0668_bin_21]MYC21170.1 hypothetical protein [Caldilineaceae bacterium SB0662_bin_25]
MTSSLNINTPMAPPHWALLQRRLLREQAEGCRAFFDHYFDDRGYLLCVPRWGGDDGPDDAAENILNWTMLHALGADDDILDLYKLGWEGHLQQYTEAKTVDVPMARDGMYFKEFPVMFDWFHNGEGFSAFFLQGLSDPYDSKFQLRCRRFAGFYMDDDPIAKNYDPEHKLIRSMFNGSRGPLLRKATGLDWAGDPIEVEGRFRLGHGERSYEEMVAHFKDYNDVVGDHPINMAATVLPLNAFMLGHEDRYRQWVLDYVDQWVERTEQNGGIIPTNVGLDNVVGSECEGRWYGGVYGWGFTVTVPQTGELAHRTYFHTRAIHGFGNATLLTGDRRYADSWRGVIDHVNSNAREIDGRLMYPNAYGDYFGEEDWYDFQDEPFTSGALEVYYWSMDPDHRDLLADDPWILYLEGNNPAFPEEALQADFERLRGNLEAMRADTATPDTRLSDDMNHINPAVTENLNKLMLGGLPTGRTGGPLHCRLRYFDPDNRRAGIPADVAALVESLTGEAVTVTLVNTSQVSLRRVTVQGGAYAEHQFGSVRLNGETVDVEDSSFEVTIAPGCGARLEISTGRYANTPTLAFPWRR